MGSSLTQRLALRKRSLTAGMVVGVVFFAVLLVVGLKGYADYGLSSDEGTQLRLGLTNYHYITRTPALDNLIGYRDQYYGPLFELILLAGYRPGMDTQQIFLNRHLINFLSFYAGCLVFFWLARRLSRSTWLGLIATAFLALSPRIFADAFYNSKDIPFLVFYIFSIASLIWFLDRPSLLRAVVHGGVTAAMLDVRLPGLVIPALTLAGLGIEVLARRIPLRKALLGGLLYGVVCSGVLVAIWPVLWHDPLHTFIEALKQMSRYPHSIGMVYLGGMVRSTNLPWHYIPVWIGVTTPLLYLGLFAVGLGAMVVNLLRPIRMALTVEQRDGLLVLGTLLLPLAVVIGLHSVLYDGWRQMFFIYAPFLLVALKGMDWGWKMLATRLPKQWALGLGIGILAVGVLPVAGWMLANHPNENVYFNRLAGADMQTIGKEFMLDYWGLAYRAGLEYITHNDPRPHIVVAVQTDMGNTNMLMLSPADQARIVKAVVGQAPDYFISNYYRNSGEVYPYPEMFSVKVGNAKILSVFKTSP
jgi:hypothetical protein